MRGTAHARGRLATWKRASCRSSVWISAAAGCLAEPRTHVRNGGRHMDAAPDRGRAQDAGASWEFADTDLSTFARWGIGSPPWLWGVRIRILFVIDGRITDSSEPTEFGLGCVIGAWGGG